MKKAYKLGFVSHLMIDVRLRNNAIIVVELKEEIAGKVMNRAVCRALEMHPIFRTRLEKRWNGFRLVHNPKLPVVKEIPWSEAVYYGTEAFNGFPWCICYTGHRLSFVCAHFLTDGMGQLSMLQSVLRLYFEELGETFSSDAGLFTPEEAEQNTIEPYSSVPIDKHGEKADKLTDPQPSLLPCEFFQADTLDHELSYFYINRHDVWRIGKSSGTSSASVLCALACKSVAMAAGMEEGQIRANMAVDLRSRYNLFTDLDFVYSVPLTYNVSALKNQPTEQAFKDLRSELDRKLKKPNLDAYIARQQMLNGPFRWLFSLLGKQAFLRTVYSRRANLVYSHITRVPFEPEILERIENVYLSGTKTSDSLMLFHAVTFGDVVTMRVNEPGSGKRTVACFAECLKAEGIRYEFRRVPDHGFMRYMPEIWE